jgi:hypothetical protein
MGHGTDYPPPTSTEVKKIVGLYLYSPSVPSSPVLGQSLLLFIVFLPEVKLLGDDADNSPPPRTTSLDTTRPPTIFYRLLLN